jgi:hypothetical protein
MEHNWNKRIYESLKPIADLDYQRKAWFGQSEYVSSFNEVINVLYDDNCFEDFIDPENWLTNGLKNSKLLEGLIELDRMIKEYEEPTSEEKIVKDPNWILITKQASMVISVWDGGLE